MEIAFLQGNGIEALPQFLTSLAIGLLIGLERERNPSAKAGLRTFALVAVFGTLAALLSARLNSPWMLIAGLLAVAGMIIAAYLKMSVSEDDSAPFERRHARPLSPPSASGGTVASLRRGLDSDPGTTTVIALLLCYGLGAMVWYGLAKLAVMLAIGITALLYFKPELR